MSAATKRILPADVYDALELSALVFGGIGAGKYAEYGPSDAPVHCDGTDAVPLCVHGHIAFVSGEPTYCGPGRVIDDVGILPLVNDRAVRTYNDRRHSRDRNARIPFAAWCAELGVERGA